jgi:chromosome segregation ATPase
MSMPNKPAKQKQKDSATMPSTAFKAAPSSGGVGEQLKTLVSVSQQLLQNHAKELCDIDGLKSENTALKEQVTQQNQEIASLKNTNQALCNTFSQLDKKRDAEKKYLEDQMKSEKKDREALFVKKMQEAQKKAQSAEAKQRETERLLDEREAQLQSAEASRIGFEKQLDYCRADLTDLRNDVGIIGLGSDLLVVFRLHILGKN